MTPRQGRVNRVGSRVPVIIIVTLATLIAVACIGCAGLGAWWVKGKADGFAKCTVTPVVSEQVVAALRTAVDLSVDSVSYDCGGSPTEVIDMDDAEIRLSTTRSFPTVEASVGTLVPALTADGWQVVTDLQPSPDPTADGPPAAVLTKQDYRLVIRVFLTAPIGFQVWVINQRPHAVGPRQPPGLPAKPSTR